MRSGGTIASLSRRTTNRPWKGRDYVTWPVLNLVVLSISRKWLKLELSNFVHREIRPISRLAKRMTNNHLHVQQTVDFAMARQLWSTMSSTTRASVSLIYSAGDTLTLKLHRFEFLCICCKLACRPICRQQIDQVEFGPYRTCMYVIITES